MNELRPSERPVASADDTVRVAPVVVDAGARDPADAEALPAARVSAVFTIAPVAAVAGNVATVLGESLLTLLAMFYPLPLCKKANVVVTELVQNVMENVADPRSEVRLAVTVDAARLVVEATNRVSPEQRAAVEKRIGELADPVAVRKLFAQTIRARRAQRLRGGLGLMRLVTENKFALSTRYEDDHLTVRAEYLLRGTE